MTTEGGQVKSPQHHLMTPNVLNTIHAQSASVVYLTLRDITLTG